VSRDELSYITKKDWDDFLKSLLDQYTIFAPQKSDGEIVWKELNEGKIPNVVYDKYRATQPIKPFFYQFLERVSPKLMGEEKARLILGAKNCDLRGIAVLDKLFLGGEFVDPFYEERRKKSVLITTDCTDAKEVCFCVLAGYDPFPKDGFDINLTPVQGGFLAEVGSDVGRRFISIKPDLWQSPDPDRIKERDTLRENVTNKVKEVNRDFKFKNSLSDIIRENYKHQVWEDEAGTCVSCGACTNICPSCNCFLLADIADGDRFAKLKYWDTCQYAGFGRVAGGANPRKELYERFRNRYLCKYNYKPEAIGMVSCTGCGRCIEACTGKIDMRKVIYRLQTKT